MVQALRGSSLEERVATLNELVKRAPKGAVEGYDRRLDMSWVYHDSALEGVVYTMEELRSALTDHVVSDSSLIPVYDEIRQHEAAIAHIRELAGKSRLKISLDVIKKIYAQLAPEELEGKSGPRYRKDT
ncbi:MAG: hypothetical protein ACOC97_05595, partial [Myxococcota bacterium]